VCEWLALLKGHQARKLILVRFDFIGKGGDQPAAFDCRASAPQGKGTAGRVESFGRVGLAPLRDRRDDVFVRRVLHLKCI